jgi:hypothetical protein
MRQASPPLYRNRSAYLSTPNITANARHALLDEYIVRAMRKKLKLRSDGGDSGSKKCKRGRGGAYGGDLAESAFGGSLESGVRRWVLCWCVWQESGFSRREDVFTLNLVYKEMLLILFFQCYFQR